jgi:hypothetical protein
MRTAAIALVATATLALTSADAVAQVDGLSVGGGIGVTASAHATGRGYHAAISLPVMPLHRGAHLRAEVMYQAGTLSASPFECERVDSFYCLGRTDENQIAAAAVFVRIPTPWFGRWRFYADPIGAGLYHRRTRSTETQGPTAFCLVGGVIVSCPDNPDWATFTYRATRTSVGANVGLGMEAQVAQLRIFAEVRAHRLFERGESVAGSVPLTLGVSF